MKDTLPHTEISTLRKQIRRKRKALNRFQLKQAENKIIFQILKIKHIHSAKNIGIYLNAFGEIPTQKIILQLLKMGKNIYLPLICNLNQQLHWQKISYQQLKNQRLMQHTLGMQQAMHHRGKLFKHLDCVIMPLVVADKFSHRIGMGGGFYDRTLSTSKKVKRIGLAHDFQVIEQRIIPQKWDENLHYLVTPMKYYFFRLN